MCMVLSEPRGRLDFICKDMYVPVHIRILCIPVQRMPYKREFDILSFGLNVDIATFFLKKKSHH